MSKQKKQETRSRHRKAGGILDKIGGPVFAVAIALSLLCCVFLILDTHWKNAVEKLKMMFGFSGTMNEILESLPAYSDVMIAVVVAIIVALLSITITMYVFLKSALDRVIDENQYIAVAANIYQNETSTKLFWVSILNFIPILLAMLWHFLLNFQSAHDFCKVEIGLALLASSLVLDAVTTVRFWNKCIRVRTELQTIIKRELARCVEDTKKFFIDEGEKEEIYQLIGYWTEWETDKIEQKVVKEDQQLTWNVEPSERDTMHSAATELCRKMKADQFINLFSRTEVMLLAGIHRGSKQVFDESDIITAIQERRNILNPIIEKKPHKRSVEEQDLDDSHYIEIGKEDGSPGVLDYIWKFRQMVGYQANLCEENDKLGFFGSTEKLYRLLKRYRDLKISERYTPEWRKVPNSDNVAEIMVMGQYYFLLRVLAMFVSAVQISDFTFNGSTLNFANFYNSTLENVSFYSTRFYHTIFTRAKLSRVIMDISDFDSVNFHHTDFHKVSLNNSNFTKVMFDHAEMVQSDLNSCDFQNCKLTDSLLTDSMLNGSVFRNSTLKSVDLSRSKLAGILWEDTPLSSCSFQNAELQDWTCKNVRGFINCNFSGSVWEKMNLFNMDMSDSVFDSASMVQAIFRRVILKNALFRDCQLPNAEFHECIQFDHSSFQGANLFNAYFYNCILRLSNLYMASMGNATLKKCCLDNSDCAESSFREAELEEVSFQYARLYNATLNWASIKQCSFKYALADHMQFTFAKCENTKFNYASLPECNLSGTQFEKCDFEGSNLCDTTATEVTLDGCKLRQVNFSGTRFVKAKILTKNVANDWYKTISDCDFSDCKFELSELSDVTFKNCMFAGAMFSNCKLTNVTFSNCTVTLQGNLAFLTRKNASLFFATSFLNNVAFRSADKPY